MDQPTDIRKLIEGEGDLGDPGLGGPPRSMRGPGGMRRPLPGRQDSPVDVLKNVLLKILTRDNSYDAPIAEKLIAGQMPDRSELQHILDEAGRLSNLTEPEMKALSEISQQF